MRGQGTRPWNSTLIATAALLVALSGGGQAIAQTARDSAKALVTSRDIKNSTITNKDIKRGTIGIDRLSAKTVRALKGATGPRGLTGAPGPAGPKGTAGTNGTNGAPGTNGSPDTAAQVLEKAKTVDGAGSGLDADTLDGITAAGFLATNAPAGGDVAGPLSNLQVGTNAITASEIADDAITSLEIAAGAVGTSEIADGTVASADIAADTIAATDIATSGVGSAEILNESIASADIDDATIVAADIATGAVASTEILDSTIASGDIALDTIDNVDIAADAVESSEIAVDAVGTSELTRNAVGESQFLTFDNINNIDPDGDPGNGGDQSFGAFDCDTITDTPTLGPPITLTTDDIPIVVKTGGSGAVEVAGATVVTATQGVQFEICNRTSATVDVDDVDVKYVVIDG